mgnify:CR=1 FL=1
MDEEENFKYTTKISRSFIGVPFKKDTDPGRKLTIKVELDGSR